ncbi:MAG: DUF4317 domain-containing protein [Lachnospiraceae bacterium]|nr:DUF4317 domain-containing protein [Lachnospiraceae bacterium]
MIKSELSEIKKLYTPKNCSVTRIAGCYVDGEKNKRSVFAKPFTSLPEEEMYKYFDIFRKALSGSIGKSALTLDVTNEAEEEGGQQDFLLKLRESKLGDDDLLDDYYNRIISSLEYVGNYLILVAHDVYDIPQKTNDGEFNEDASDDIYEYILTVICPVDLTDAGLAYDPDTNEFHDRKRDWIVKLPMLGYLFPAFNDRNSDIHSIMYYSKDSENLNEQFIDMMLGAFEPMSAGSQKETFEAIVEETLGEECSFNSVKNIHEEMSRMIADAEEQLAPLTMEKKDIKGLLEASGSSNKKLKAFDATYEKVAPDDKPLMMSNVYSARSFDVKTPDVVVKVKPDRTDLVNEKSVDGKDCLVIELNGEVVVNGINVRAETEGEHE